MDGEVKICLMTFSQMSDIGSWPAQINQDVQQWWPCFPANQMEECSAIVQGQPFNFQKHSFLLFLQGGWPP